MLESIALGTLVAPVVGAAVAETDKSIAHAVANAVNAAIGREVEAGVFVIVWVLAFIAVLTLVTCRVNIASAHTTEYINISAVDEKAIKKGHKFFIP